MLQETLKDRGTYMFGLFWHHVLLIILLYIKFIQCLFIWWIVKQPWNKSRVTRFFIIPRVDANFLLWVGFILNVSRSGRFRVRLWLFRVRVDPVFQKKVLNICHLNSNSLLHTVYTTVNKNAIFSISNLFHLQFLFKAYAVLWHLCFQ